MSSGPATEGSDLPNHVPPDQVIDPFDGVPPRMWSTGELHLPPSLS